MKKNLLTTFLLSAFPFILFSTNVIEAISSGDWHDTNTWSGGIIPSATNDVLIRGYSVTLKQEAGNIIINSLLIDNNTNEHTDLILLDAANLRIKTTFSGMSYNHDKHISIQVYEGSILSIDGNANLIRTIDNNKKGELGFDIQDGSIIEIGGNLLFDYKNGKSTENGREISISNNSSLVIGGNLSLFIREGKALEIELLSGSTLSSGGALEASVLGGHRIKLTVDPNSNFTIAQSASFLIDSIAEKNLDLMINGGFAVGGDLSLDAAVTATPISFVASGTTANVDIDGDIIMTAQNAGDLSMSLQNSATLNLAGNFERPSNFGSFEMDASSTVTLDGEEEQTVPTNTVNSAGGDSFNFTNINLNNTSGIPMGLAGPIIVEDELVLTNGIINTTETNKIIVTNGAIITGGSSTAYIDGPITKIGDTNGESFVFPTGHGNVYAPIQISPLLNQNDEITIQYRDDPPPIREEKDASINSLNGLGYWIINSAPGNEIPYFTLNWMDAQRRGIENSNNAIVAFVDTTVNSETPQWTNLGQSSSSGGTGSGISGSITQALDDPPPIREEGFLTVGFFSPLTSTGASSVILPVELKQFTATRYNDLVNLQWETETEINSHYFEIERSADGQNFEAVGIMYANGNSTSSIKYGATDSNPFIGENYYRLKIVDLDGSYEFSDVAFVFFEKGEDPVLYPNPVSDLIQIFGGDQLTGEVQIQLIDQLGRQITIRQEILENGKLVIPVKTLGLKEGGIYYLNMKMENGQFHAFKFILTH